MKNEPKTILKPMIGIVGDPASAEYLGRVRLQLGLARLSIRNGNSKRALEVIGMAMQALALSVDMIRAEKEPGQDR